ncbi:hypothetical protein WJX82_008314 [Trebouxia sp. C0006]
MQQVLQVKHFWDSTTEQQRAELLTLNVDCLHRQAARLTDPKGVTKVLAQGLTRLAKTGTWKQWQWDASSKPHTTAASFRNFMVQQRVPQALQRLLQQAQESTASTEALDKLQSKLLELQKGIAERHQSEASAQRTRPWQYNRSSAVINMIFAALTSQEHIFLHHMFGCAVNRAVWTLLSPDQRSEKPPAENADSVLNFENIDKLPADDLDRITAWMESMLASLCQLNNGLDTEQNQAELFSLSSDSTKLKINPEVLFHHHTVPAIEHCNLSSSALPSSTSAGPVLDWIYGCKAVPTPSNPLPGMPASPVAQRQLIQDMVQNKLHVAKCESSLGKSLRPSWPSNEAAVLPPAAVLCLLRQELNVAIARSHHVSHHLDIKMLTSMYRLNQQISQAKAEQAFWSAKNPRLQIEPCDCLNGRLTRLHHQRQRDSFWRDITSHAVNFEKILTPLEDRINES